MVPLILGGPLPPLMPSAPLNEAFRHIGTVLGSDQAGMACVLVFVPIILLTMLLLAVCQTRQSH